MEQVLLTERLGFDFVAFGERHMYEAGFLEPLTAMASALARTWRIRVALAVLLLPTYDPLRLAEMVAMMDWVSKGRVIFGVGLGYRPEELEAYGVPLKERASRFEEALTVIRRLWTEPKVTFHGRYFHYDDAFVSPKPVQKPHPPILIGGVAPKAVERAARLGDGWVSTTSEKHSELRSLIELYRAVAQRYSGSKGEVTVMREASIAQSYEEAKEAVSKPLLKLYDLYRRWGNPHISSMPELDFDELGEDRFILGSPDDFIAEMERYQAIGVDQMIFRLDLEGIPQRRVLEAIRLLGEKVLPHFEESEQRLSRGV